MCRAEISRLLATPWSWRRFHRTHASRVGMPTDPDTEAAYELLGISRAA